MISQSPSTNWTYLRSGATRMSRANPSFRARAAEKGRDMSKSTTSAPIDRASSALPSVDFEST